MIGTAVFLALVVIGLAGADKPPPPGFLLWVAVSIAAGIGVWLRAPRWQQRPLIAIRDGALAGLSAGVILSVSGGEPSVEAPWWALFVFIAVMTAVGVILGGLAGVAVRRRSAGGET